MKQRELSTHRITTLAAVKLMPMPPALVDKRKHGIDSFSLNSSTRDCRTSTAVAPVNSRYLIFCILKTDCKISRICVNYTGHVKTFICKPSKGTLTCEKINVRRPSVWYSFNSLRRV